ncbi:ABC transporter permease subunit [bacterium]|nr:ABC transporter permease subunit [bacterium]
MIRGLTLAAAFVALWQLAVWLGGLPRFVLPPPVSVFAALVDHAALLADHGFTTLLEVMAGLVLGTALGIGLALALHLWPAARRVVEPVLVASQAVPVFVLAPVLTLWLGYGLGPKVAVTVLLVFFPVLGGLIDAMDRVPDTVLDLARIARAPRWREVLFLRLPTALPGLRAGLRIGATFAPTGAVIGEWVGASKGLGYLMLMANARSQADLMFAALVLVIALTLAVRRLADWAVGRLIGLVHFSGTVRPSTSGRLPAQQRIARND